jgi:hypothetical protein
MTHKKKKKIKFLFSCIFPVLNLLWSSRIDSQPGLLVRQPYLTYRPAKEKGVIVKIMAQAIKFTVMISYQ